MAVSISSTQTPGVELINTLRPRQNRRHFPDYIFKWIFLNQIICISMKIEVCSYRFNWQYSSIGSDNGLAPTMRQAIIWTNGG